MATESVVVNTAYCLSPNGLMTVFGFSLITMIGVSPTGIMECPDMPVGGLGIAVLLHRNFLESLHEQIPEHRNCRNQATLVLSMW